MFKVYTSNIVTSQKISRRSLISKKIKKMIPAFTKIMDLASVILFLPFLLFVFNSYFEEFINLDYFRIKNIEFRGFNLLEKRDGIKYLNLIGDVSIFDIDRDGIKNRFMTTKIVDSIQIRKKYPDAIIVDVSEKSPFIQLKQDGKYHVYDGDFSLLLILDSPLPDLFSIEVLSKGDFFKFMLKEKNSKEKLKNFFNLMVENKLLPDNLIMNANDMDNIFLRSNKDNLTILMGCGDLDEKLGKFKRFLFANRPRDLHDMVIDNRFEDMIIVRKN